ncbi:hypothetical protein TRFO_04723 [Tritrichomonas foetus]|uniref:Uncharacterized protein n=1 Tax=Tritrichomonas foetus TaxID=1144522 RepID=A0A1J4KDX7_9EUKA|nr:hypothetical protein TRFO_04723 [Tritrichomonas foetus]|eukprot:OHT09112.1 hypothetical protein TRFO_04723 [Tritrichomonas foetus]
MEQLQKDVAGFTGHFDELLLSLHKAFLDAQLKFKTEQFYQNALKAGDDGLTEIDRLIGECMKYLDNEGIQNDMTELLVSYRPRLEGEIACLKEAINGPKVEEKLIIDDEFNETVNNAELEILALIQKEQEKIEKIKQCKKDNISVPPLTREDLFSRNSEVSFQQENNNNSFSNPWNLNQEDFLIQKEKKKKTVFNDDDFDFPVVSNQEESNENENHENENHENEKDSENEIKNNYSSDYSSDEEVEDSPEEIARKQKLANDLLSQFLGSNQDSEPQNDENLNDNQENNENDIEIDG